MKICCILHAGFEPPGYFKTWAENNNYQLDITRVFKGEKIPSPQSFDFLLLMGGPQSPCELEKYPYLKEEIQLIKASLDDNKHVLGVCLGAQLIAEAMSAKTERSPNKEMGVFPIECTAAAEGDLIFKHFPKRFEVGHWHNDMPGLPKGATVLAASEGCPRQIINFAPRAYGFQCHFEFDTNCIDGLITHAADDLTDDTYVQNPEKMLAADFADINQHLDNFLSKFTKL